MNKINKDYPTLKLNWYWVTADNDLNSNNYVGCKCWHLSSTPGAKGCGKKIGKDETVAVNIEDLADVNCVACAIKNGNGNPPTELTPNISVWKMTFSTKYPTEYPHYYWINTGQAFNTWICHPGCGKNIEPYSVVAVRYYMPGTNKLHPLGHIQCISCASTEGHGKPPHIGVHGKYFSTWIESCPEDTICTNKDCETEIPAGSKCCKHIGSIDGGYGCISCGENYWAGPLPCDWNPNEPNVITPASDQPLKIISFGYKFGPLDIPKTVRIVDVRKCVRNPWRVKSLRKLVGYDPKVLDFVSQCKGAKRLLDSWTTASSSYFSYATGVAFGCHGGKHRSVAMAELLAKRLIGQGRKVEVIHRDLLKK